jgi:hypothetical protein
MPPDLGRHPLVDHVCLVVLLELTLVPPFLSLLLVKLPLEPARLALMDLLPCSAAALAHGAQ